MILSVPTESMILSASGAESITLSVPPWTLVAPLKRLEH
jgi:hypothetical protein